MCRVSVSSAGTFTGSSSAWVYFIFFFSTLRTCGPCRLESWDLKFIVPRGDGSDQSSHHEVHLASGAFNISCKDWTRRSPTPAFTDNPCFSAQCFRTWDWRKTNIWSSTGKDTWLKAPEPSGPRWDQWSLRLSSQNSFYWDSVCGQTSQVKDFILHSWCLNSGRVLLKRLCARYSSDFRVLLLDPTLTSPVKVLQNIVVAGSSFP